jgi:hypothetical protein
MARALRDVGEAPDWGGKAGGRGGNIHFFSSGGRLGKAHRVRKKWMVAGFIILAALVIRMLQSSAR